MGKRQFTSSDPEFDDWWEELNQLAQQQKLTWCLSPEQEDHRDGFENGDSQKTNWLNSVTRQTDENMESIRWPMRRVGN